MKIPIKAVFETLKRFETKILKLNIFCSIGTSEKQARLWNAKKQNALSSNLMQIFRKSIECKLSFINKIKADLLFQSYVWIRTNLLKHFSLTQGHDKVSQTIMPPKTIET